MRDSARQPSGATRREEQSFDELLSAPNITDAERNQLRAEATIGHAAALLVLRGEKKLAELLLEVKNAVVEPDYQGNEEDLWLEIAPESQQLFSEEATEAIKAICMEVSQRRGYGVDWVGIREIMPTVGPHWREQVRERLTGKRQTNQGRTVRLESPRIIEDNLAFTNRGELAVYRALKQIQEKDYSADETIAIFPLPGGRVPGHTWEPDVLVTYRGRTGVLEIDGPHHNNRRALDNSRDHLLRDAGIAFVDRVTVEALDDPNELYAVLRRFLRRLGDTK